MVQVILRRWARLLSGLAIYALAFWGGWYALEVAFTFLESFEIPHTQSVMLVLFGMLLISPLVLVYRLGVWVGSRLWLLSPVLVIILPTYYIPVLGQRYLGWPSDPGWTFVIIIAIIYALVTLVPAVLGVQVAFDREEVPLDMDISVRNPALWAVPVTLAGAAILVLGLVSGMGMAVIIGLTLFIAGAVETGAWKFWRIWR